MISDPLPSTGPTLRMSRLSCASAHWKKGVQKVTWNPFEVKDIFH
jgi:hypothetical protein